MKRFVVGFVVGATVGGVVVILVTPKTGLEMVESMKARMSEAIRTGRQTAESHEKELWDDFRKRLHQHHHATDLKQGGISPPAFC